MMRVRNDLFRDDVEHCVMDDSERVVLDVSRKGGAYRLRNGRFSSRYDALRDKYAKRVSWLEFEREKYQRAWLAACDLQSYYARECERLRGILRGNNISF